MGTDPFVAAKPDARLVNLLIRAHRFNATLIGSADLRFAALAKQEGVKPCNYWPHGVVPSRSLVSTSAAPFRLPRALPSSVHSLEPRSEPSAAICSRRV